MTAPLQRSEAPGDAGVPLADAPTPVGVLRRRAGTGHTASLYVGGAIAAVLVATALLSLFVHLGDPNATDLLGRLHSPDGAHLAGTDELGRDILARLVRGVRWSLGIGTIATAIAVTIGATLGTIGAWRPGVVRTLMVRSTDIGISFPFLVIAVVIVAVVGHGFWPLTLTLGVVAWPTMARVIYAQARGLCEREYVLAARLAGVGGLRSLLTHVLPPLVPHLQVMAAFTFADLLVAESGLSFLGLGAPLGEATWGNMLSASRAYLIQAPWMMLGPATAIVLAVLAANLVGDGLTARDHAKRSRSAA